MNELKFKEYGLNVNQQLEGPQTAWRICSTAAKLESVKHTRDYSARPYTPRSGGFSPVRRRICAWGEENHDGASLVRKSAGQLPTGIICRKFGFVADEGNIRRSISADDRSVLTKAVTDAVVNNEVIGLQKFGELITTRTRPQGRTVLRSDITCPAAQEALPQRPYAARTHHQHPDTPDQIHAIGPQGNRTHRWRLKC